MGKRILITGGAGFIGSAVVREVVRATPHQVTVVDKLTYAGNLDNLAPVADDPRKTVEWYLANRSWWTRIRSGLYRGERLGVVA